MSKLVHNVRAYTFWFLQFYIAYTTLNKFLAVFFINNICGFTKEFVKTSQMAVEILRFSAFSKMAPAAILDFVVVQKWHKGTVRAANVQQHTKFGEDIWNNGQGRGSHGANGAIAPPTLWRHCLSSAPPILRPNVTFYKFLKCFLHILRVKKIQVREL